MAVCRCMCVCVLSVVTGTTTCILTSLSLLRINTVSFFQSMRTLQHCNSIPHPCSLWYCRYESFIHIHYIQQLKKIFFSWNFQLSYREIRRTIYLQFIYIFVTLCFSWFSVLSNFLCWNANEKNFFSIYCSVGQLPINSPFIYLKILLLNLIFKGYFHCI